MKSSGCAGDTRIGGASSAAWTAFWNQPRLKVPERHEKLKGGDLKSLDVVPNKVAGVSFHTKSPFAATR